MQDVWQTETIKLRQEASYNFYNSITLLCCESKLQLKSTYTFVVQSPCFHADVFFLILHCNHGVEFRSVTKN